VTKPVSDDPTHWTCLVCGKRTVYLTPYKYNNFTIYPQYPIRDAARVTNGVLPPCSVCGRPTGGCCTVEVRTFEEGIAQGRAEALAEVAAICDERAAVHLATIEAIEQENGEDCEDSDVLIVAAVHGGGKAAHEALARDIRAGRAKVTP
jgi:hypothetical protein